MTVEELMSLNQMITDATITVRKDGSALLDELNIGCERGIEPRFPTMVPKKEQYIGTLNLSDRKKAAYIPKSINAWDDGHDYWQVKVNRIPKNWLSLEVYAWEVSPASTVVRGPHRRNDYGNSYRNINFHGQMIHITALPNGQKLTVPEEKPKDEQMDGQMSFEDWNYEVMEI